VKIIPYYEEVTVMSKTDKIMNKVGIIALCVAAFCWGWNSDHFKN
jgi:hypothetical protein